LNTIRNKYAHKIEYVITNEEVDKLAESIKNIKLEEINHGGYVHQVVEPILKDGIYAIALMKELPPDLEENRIRICKLVTSAHCMCLLGAFWLINTLHVKGKLKLSKA
ncbi:hypothetical protein P9365_24710, partial [Escherichia coli]